MQSDILEQRLTAARQALARGDTRTAHTALQRVLRREPRQPLALLLLAEVRLREGQVYARTRGAGGDFPARAASLLEAVSKDPPVTRAMLGVLDHDDAVDAHVAARRLGVELTSLDETLRRCLGPEAGA